MNDRISLVQISVKSVFKILSLKIFYESGDKIDSLHVVKDIASLLLYIMLPSTRNFVFVLSLKLLFLLHIYIHSFPTPYHAAFDAPCSTSPTRKQRSMTSCKTQVRMFGGFIVYDLKFRFPGSQIYRSNQKIILCWKWFLTKKIQNS